MTGAARPRRTATRSTAWSSRATILVLLTLVACDGGGATPAAPTFEPPRTNPPLPTLPADETATVTTTTEDSGTATAASSNVTASPTTSTDPGSGAPEPTRVATIPPVVPPAAVEEAVAVETWQAAWRAAASGDAEALDGLASNEIAARWTTLFEDQVARDIVHATFVVPADGAAVGIDECAVITPPLTGGGAAHFTGVVAAGPDGTPRVVDLQTNAMFDGCVPEPVAAQAVAAYVDYWDAYFAIGADPDPTDPRIAAIATGGHRASLEQLFEDLRRRGLVLRGPPEVHPEVSAYSSPADLTIYDCQVPDPAYGVYDGTTGELTDLDLPVRPGSRDEKDVDMILEDGRWKVAERRGQSDVGCVHPSGLGVNVVGGATR